MNKTIYFFAGLVSAVLIASVFSLVSAKWFWEKDAQLAPTVTSPTNIINANECTRDGVCEVNTFVTRNLAETNTIINPTFFKNKIFITHPELEHASLSIVPQSDGNVDFGMRQGGVLAILGPLSVTESAHFGNGFSSSGLVQFLDRAIFSGSSVQITYLGGGNGTAYVCVDSRGILFRSVAPCK